MVSKDLSKRLGRIFETGIHYNIALLQYKGLTDVAKLLEERLSLTCTEYEKRYLVRKIDTYLYEHNPSVASQILHEVNIAAKDYLLILMMQDLKASLTLSWPLHFFFAEMRSTLRPEWLLKKYFQVYRTTNGFTDFNLKSLQPTFDELAILETIREENLMIYNRVKIDVNQSGHILIHYDKTKTSFRQALLLSHSLEEQQDALKNMRFLKARTIDQYGGVLAALDCRFHNNKIEPYYNDLTKKYPAETESGFADIKVISRGFDFLCELQDSIAIFYEKNKADVSRETINHRQENSLNSSAQVDPMTMLTSRISIFINYYSYVLANPSFFKKLVDLKTRLAADIKNVKHKPAEPHKLIFLLNFINHKVYPGNPDKEDLEYFNEKYKQELTALRSYPISKHCWGILCHEEFVPSLTDLIKYLKDIKMLVLDDFSLLTHSHLESADTRSYLQNALIIKKVVPSLTKETFAGYGLGSPATVMPMSEEKSVADNLRAALDFFDQQSFKNHLSQKVITKNVRKLEELLWGLFYYYQIEWSEKKLSQEKCIEAIGACYDSPICDSRFRAGKKAAKQHISLFTVSKSM